MQSRLPNRGWTSISGDEGLKKKKFNSQNQSSEINIKYLKSPPQTHFSVQNFIYLYRVMKIWNTLWFPKECLQRRSDYKKMVSLFRKSTQYNISSHMSSTWQNFICANALNEFCLYSSRWWTQLCLSNLQQLIFFYLTCKETKGSSFCRSRGMFNIVCKVL